ncbi:MAG TPA: aminopeptidase P family protein [Clostridia bacterium]|nr:aminopeptidase P family protein [Clostridia bacterium]
MTGITDRIQGLREGMLDRGIDAYIVPSSDPHMSEYVAAHWEGRKWLSGFTGSAGTLVITRDFSGLWTDGRYYVQAEKQLQGTGIQLFKAGMEGVKSFTQWIADTLDKGSCVGVDGKLFSLSQVRKMESRFSKKGISINKEHDLLMGIWKDRPPIPNGPVFVHDIAYAGRTAAQKIEDVRARMTQKGTDYHLVSSLDDIAWLYNIRGSDVDYNPVAISYALVSDERAWLFINGEKVSEPVREHLKDNGIEVEDYEEIESHLSRLGEGDTILLDVNRVNSWLYNAIPDGVGIEEDTTITTTLKAIKNETEIENLKRAHVRDGVAMVRFLYWLDNNISKGDITEITVADKLEEYRSQQENYVGLSFPTIAGYEDHGAIVHYQADEESAYTLGTDGMILIDSGCQYLDGTTDITRTIPLGATTSEERRDYTLTLKGNIKLTRTRFLKGATGANLDILARLHLWEHGIDYKHGTGHGVGYFLNVHEGPQGISPISSRVRLEAGMLVTNEPGVYREGSHGIRIENELLVVEDIETEFGEFLRFEPITLCPIDLAPIELDLLDEGEKRWLNEYHKWVYDILSPLLNQEESLWLKDKTRAI